MRAWTQAAMLVVILLVFVLSKLDRVFFVLLAVVFFILSGQVGNNAGGVYLCT